jgi:release factor glutamine methyltransferase
MTFREAHHQIILRLNPVYAAGEAAAMADLVIENISGRRRTEIILAKEPEMSGEQIKKLDEIINRLLTGEPVQYVLNEAWFCGFRFYVNNKVLIPRPETEELVEWIISDCRFPVDQLRILDIGTGSGCIAVSLKRRIRKAEVWACDNSADALTIARRNSDTLGAVVDFIQLDFLNPVEREQLPHRFDVIVSNPPYIPIKDKDSLPANVKDHEPVSALFVPDNDPLLFYRHIAVFGKMHLNEAGKIYVEINEEHGEGCLNLFRSEHYDCELRRDMQGKERMIIARSSQQLLQNPFLRSSLP